MAFDTQMLTKGSTGRLTLGSPELFVPVGMAPVSTHSFVNVIVREGSVSRAVAVLRRTTITR